MAPKRAVHEPTRAGTLQRARLLDAAFAVLAREGDTRPDAVARGAGSSKALVFHHFGSVAGLHFAMVERVMQETQAGLAAIARENPTPRARVEALARALLAEPPESPAEARRVLRFWLADGDRGATRDALVADFIGDAKKADLVLARWHGATVRYATGRAVDFEREADALVDELDRMTRG